MRRRPALAFLFALVLAHLALPAFAHGVRRFVNGRWWDGSSFRPGERFAVEGVLRERWDGKVDQTVDLGGGWVVPALGDAHSHGLAAPDWRDDEQGFLAAGVFYVGNPNSLGSMTAGMRQALAGGEHVQVLYANGGLTSPGGHPAQIYAGLAQHLGLRSDGLEGNAYWEIADAAALDRRWPDLAAGKPDFLKVYLEHSEDHARRRSDPAFFGRRGLDPALLPAVVTKAHAAGWRVLAHVSTASDFRTAVAAGVDQVAHLPLEPITAADAAAAAKAGVAVVTTWVSHRPTDGFADPKGAMRANLRLLLDAGAAILLGTDNALTVLDEMEALEREAGIDRPTLLRLAASATPRWLYPQRRLGGLAEGDEASFVVVSGDPTADLAVLRRIDHRVMRGHLLPAMAPAERRDAPAHPPAHGGENRL